MGGRQYISSKPSASQRCVSAPSAGWSGMIRVSPIPRRSSFSGFPEACRRSTKRGRGVSSHSMAPTRIPAASSWRMPVKKSQAQKTRRSKGMRGSVMSASTSSRR
ncbi:MAG: hypothetical protein CMN31_04020 [Sandaracinus sp.]|nr:hypothetical protein [Sandaracinus sp.]MBJ70525.1 hypothetical protein [Sandaracinus sp.]